MAEGCPEPFPDREFLSFILNFEQKSAPQFMEQVDRFCASVPVVMLISTYIKGKRVKNDAVHVAHREQAVKIIEDILMLVDICREMEGLLAEGEEQRAGATFREIFISVAD